MLFSNLKYLLLKLFFTFIVAVCIAQPNQSKTQPKFLPIKIQKKKNEIRKAKYLTNWKVVKQEHPKVSELHIGISPQFHNKFRVFFDTLQAIPTAKEAIKLTKTVLNFKEYNDIKGQETEDGFEGHWYHKNIRVVGYYFKYKYLYKIEENFNEKYGSYMYAHIDTTVNFDTTNTITKQEAIVIAKEKSLPHKLDGTIICWDEEDNKGCYPKIEAMMTLGSTKNVTSINFYGWTFDIANSKKHKEFKFSSSVNGFTGKFTQGSAALDQ